MHALLLLLALGARAEDAVAPPAAVPPADAASLPDPEWGVATSRMLGAAGTVRDRAWRLRETAAQVRERGRIGGLSALASDSRELHQAVASATLAAEVLVEKAAPAN